MGVTWRERDAPLRVNIHFEREAIHIASVDLAERAEAISVQIAVVGWPRAGLWMRYFFKRHSLFRGGTYRTLCRRCRRFRADDLSDLVFREQGELSLRAQELQIKLLSFFKMPSMVLPSRSRTVAVREAGRSMLAAFARAFNDIK